MTLTERLLTPARRAWRALWPVLVVAAGAVTCDSPMAPKPAMINVAPLLDFASLNQYAGLTVDHVHLVVVRPPSDTLANTTVPFSVDSASLTANLEVAVNGTEQLDVTIELLAGTQVVFSGTQQVSVTAGAMTQPTQPIPVSYTGPGAGIASIQIAPRDSGATFGSAVPFRVTAFDAQANPVGTFYVGWSTTSGVSTSNATGLFTAGAQRGVVWVKAHTPTGIWDSTRITVSPVANQVQIVSGSGQTASAGSSLPQQLVVKVLAADNLPVVGVPVTFAATGGGSVTPANTVSDTLGFARATATLGASVGTANFTATIPNVAPVTFSQTATSGVATKLGFNQQPSTTVAGVVMAPAVTVALLDAANNTVSTSGGTVTIALTSAGGATLGGTLTQPISGGVATFNNLTVDKAASYTLTATSTGLASGTSNSFTINPAAATAMALVSGNNQGGAPNAQLAQPLVVKVTDAFGNAVPNRAITFAVTAGGGSVASPNVNTNASGQASTTWTIGASGTQTATATSAGLTGSPVTFTATLSGVVSTTLNLHLDSLFSWNDTVTLVPTSRNQSNAVVSGNYTWVSRTPGVATVNSAGLVTTVTDGSTYVVVTEAGGTKDSALVVVQQRVATINVTPGNRSIYLTRTFQFSAAAVDGRGNTVASVTNFTWSSTATAVATVNSSGFMTGVGLGVTQIRAQAGSVIGVSNVSVLTPITRIAVVVDSVGAFKTDTFSMASLGIQRRYRAVAHDTLDAVMSGVTFAWQSTNGSVAIMNTTSGDTASVTSAANGLTRINASAQGFTSAPGALLTVQQVLSSIALTPPLTNPTANIAINGTISLQARGKDANNRFIPAGSFTAPTFSSAAASIATVNATSGLVTGQANGTADITATSGGITSNILTVTVGGGSVPQVISFGNDTVSVGRGSTASIPILLSTPSGQNLTVNLSSPAFAHWQSPTVVITAGQTSANATLVGDSAGTTTVTAADGSGLGYASGTATAKVTANMSLATCCFNINATDIVQTQVVLSDPSPAGGTYVTFGFGTPNVAAISPDPAFIPQGQLAADIQIRGLGAGTTTIVPSAIGVNGQAGSITVYAPILSMSQSNIRIGAGQYEPNLYVQAPTYTNVAIPITLTSSDTNVATASSPITIPGGQYYTYFQVNAKAIGSATVTGAAPGWTVNTPITVTATTPAVGVCCGYQIFTTSGQQGFTVYAEDSTRNAHYRTNSLIVHLKSSDTTVLKVIDTVVTIAPGSYYSSAGHVAPGGGAGGSAYLIATASGHFSDSTQWTVQGPPLSFGWVTSRIGAGQEDQMYIQAPTYVAQPLVVTLVSSDSNAVGVPTTVTIPQGNYYTYFALRGKATGSASIVATAVGYQPDTASTIVTTPRITSCCGGSFYNFGPGQGMSVYAADSVGNAHVRSTPLAVTVASLSPGVASIDSTTITIPAGQYYSHAAQVKPVSVGSTQVTYSAAGHTVADSLPYTVLTPYVSLNWGTLRIGRRQQTGPNGLYVQLPDYRTSPLVVTLQHSNPIADSLSTLAVTVPTNNYYQYFDAFGLQTGVDTVIASAPGYTSDTAVVVITTPALSNCCLPSQTTTTNPPIGVTLYATDSTGNVHNPMDSVVVSAAASDTTVIRPTQPVFRIPKGQYYTSTTVTVVGPGSNATVTYTDSAGTGYQPTTTSGMTVVGPGLSISGIHMLGMRQSGGVNSGYVQVPNTLGSPLTVNLVSTDTRVVTVPATVIIPAGQYYAYFEIVAKDTVGTIQVQATATGYTQTSMNVQVTLPRFYLSVNTQTRTTGGPQGFSVQATDANGNIHYPTENVTVTLLSSAPGVAGIDSTTVQIDSGSYYSHTAHWLPGVVGTSQLTASDQRAVLYQYQQASANLSVVNPNTYLSWNGLVLGVGQYQDYNYAQVDDYAVSPINMTFANLGAQHAQPMTNLTSTPITGITIPVNNYYQYLRITGTSVGNDTIVGSVASPFHRPDTAVTIVTLGRLDPDTWPTSITNGDSVLVTIRSRDANGNAHPVLNALNITLAGTGIAFTGASVTGGNSVTIAAGQQSVSFYVKATASGTGSVTFSATNYTNYTNTVTIP